jgi:phosphate acetyltransferase
VAREAGLRGSRRASHVFIMDIPGYDRPLLMTDCVVNIFPSLMEKRDIAQNAVDLAHAIGIVQPRVALLSAVETVNPAIPGTIDAAALCKMADRGQITGGIFDGPLAYDNAISLHSAHNKGIVSDVAGRPDILLAPNLEAGNMIYKQLVYMANAECAGLVLGMRVPIVLTSRSTPWPAASLPAPWPCWPAQECRHRARPDQGPADTAAGPFCQTPISRRRQKRKSLRVFLL